MKRWLLLLVLLWPVQAQAHPHAFIDIRSTLEFNAAGELVSIREYWLFDQYYTEFALHDFGYDPKMGGESAKLLELANENLRNLTEFNYFTMLEAQGKAVKLPKHTAVKSYMEKNRLVMEFTLPLSKPVVGPFSVRIFDPSYYTAMLYLDKQPITLTGEGAAHCTHELGKPVPDAVWTTLAAGLDKSATAPDDLGSYFAEEVKISCGK